MANRAARPVRLLVALVASMLLSSTGAAGETWDGGGANNNWSTDANWNAIRGLENPPPNDGTADIVMAGTTRLTPLADVPYSIRSLTPGATAQALGDYRNK